MHTRGALLLLAVLLFALTPPLALAQDEARVLRSTFTTDIQGREPVDQVDTLHSDVRRIFYFLEVAGMQGRDLHVRWEYEGDAVAEVALPVGASRWRTWSSKDLRPEWTGRWAVVVSVDEQVLQVDEFVYSAQLPRRR